MSGQSMPTPTSFIANMAPSSTSDNIALNNNHLKQKRARSQLSCSPCRTGKLKCNREKPHCDQCIKRSREVQCIYIPPPVKHKPVQNVKGRIRQLEELVVDLMNQDNVAAGPQQKQNRGQEKTHESMTSHDQPTPPTDSDTSPQDDVDAATAPFGAMRISKNEISYVGDSHWGAILNSISDLKRDLDDDEDEEETAQQLNENSLGRSATNSYAGWASAADNPPPQTAATSGLGFLLGSTQAVTKEQLIAGVPEKKVADRMLSLWFNSPDPFKGIIHAPTFQEEYKRFWRSPKDTPTMWFGLLFAIMSLGASFGLRDADPSSPQAQKVLDEVNRYHSLSASAAVLADFTKPKEYTIECLIAYTAGLRSGNAFLNIWLMIGLIVRLALRMGYHRDAKHYPNITPFHGEMRRRTWAAISMIDVLISFQLGLPSMVKTIQSDAQPPRNLLDRDFNMATTVLPQGRGVDELTPSSYTRAKLGITRVFANAAELSHATVPPAYEDLTRLDRELEEAKALIPPLLQMPDISELVTDPAEQLMCRFNLDLLYLKTKTVLHRRYMLTPLAELSSEEQKLGIGRSRKVCTECALRVLQHHHTIYTASQPSGQLESVKWYMGSISTHDFLLAAMIICLELSTQLQADKYILVNPSGHRCPRRGALIEALEKSQRIWAESTRRRGKENGFDGSDDNRKGEQMFDETEKAARAMGVMIEKVKVQFGASQVVENLREAGVGDVGVGTEYWREAVLEGNRKSREGEARRPFNGIVSTYEWGGVQGVSEGGGEVGGKKAFGEFETVTGNELGGMAGVPELGGGAHGDFMASGDAQLVNGSVNPIGDATTRRHVSFGDGGTGSSSGFMPGSSSNDTSPSQNQTQQQDSGAFGQGPDFSMIGDMLDFSSADGADMNVDWEVWDHQITKGQATQESHAWADQTTVARADELYNIRSGNAMVRGSGVAGTAADAGAVGRVNTEANLWGHHFGASGPDIGMNAGRPAGMPGTSASGSGGATVIPRGPSTVAFGPGIWSMDFGTDDNDDGVTGAGTTDGGVGGDDDMDFDMSIPLKDVSFDLGVASYGRSGMYPASKEDWREFWGREGTGGTTGT